MRATLVLVSILSLAACSKAHNEASDEHLMTTDVATTTNDAIAAPGIAVTAAPGVAFNYRYAFRLPPARIAAAQEVHAQACEKLGISRCRITGMRYTLLGDDRVAAMLAFKLDPTLARAFGKQGIVSVDAADGMLTNAEIAGTDAGAAIERAQQQLGDARARLASIDEQLARPGLTKDARAVIEEQRAEIAQAPAQTNSQIADLRDSLATTPMVFDYESGTVIRSFDPRSPFADALATVTASAQTTLMVVLQVLAALVPPLILAALLWWLWRALTPLRTRITRTRSRPEPSSD
jgi:hypothetical protein